MSLALLRAMVQLEDVYFVHDKFGINDRHDVVAVDISSLHFLLDFLMEFSSLSHVFDLIGCIKQCQFISGHVEHMKTVFKSTGFHCITAFQYSFSFWKNSSMSRE